MSLLSKSEIQFLKGQKQVSKSYEYKLKSILKKKLANLLGKDLPLLSSMFPDSNLTNNSKIISNDTSTNLTKFSKIKTLDNNIVKTTKNYNNPENYTSLNTHKLYKCTENNQIKRVRSVVRISRRSSEPQIVGSKPIGPVIHMGSNNSLYIITIGDIIAC